MIGFKFLRRGATTPLVVLFGAKLYSVKAHGTPCAWNTQVAKYLVRPTYKLES